LSLYINANHPLVLFAMWIVFARRLEYGEK